MADQDDSLLREVDEELRRERMEKLWKRYGNLFVALSLGVVAAVAGYKGWQYYQQQQAEQAGQAYIAALDMIATGKTDAAADALRQLANGRHPAAAGLAKLRLAALLAKQGKADEAAALYRAVADDSALELPLRDAARVRHGWLLADTASLTELQKLLAGLDVDGNPWRTAAREILALAALRTGDEKAARTWVRQIIDDAETPVEARNRAMVLLARLSGDAQDTTAAPSTPASPAADNAAKPAR